jgi:hypothetical protein
MSQIITPVWTTEQGHRDFVKTASEFKYNGEGPLLKGYSKPQISEVRLYIHRLPDEHVEEYLAHLSARTAYEFDGYDNKVQGGHYLGYLGKLLNWLTPFKQRKKAKGVLPMKLGDTWCNVFLMGVTPDPEQDPGIDGIKKRQIL